MRRLQIGHDSGLLLEGKPLSLYGCFLGVDGVQVGESNLDSRYVRVAGSPLSFDVSLHDSQGSLYTGMRQIRVHIACVGDEHDIVQAKAAVGALHGARVRLGWRGLPGEYEGRVSVGVWRDVWAIESGSLSVRGVGLVTSSCTLSMEANPYLVGELVRVPFASMVDVDLSVCGNKPTPPTFTLHPVSGVQDIRLYVNGMTVTVPSSNAAWSTGVTLTVDYERRVALVNSSVVPVSLYSRFDWLRAGVNTVRVEGADGSVSFTPYTFI